MAKLALIATVELAAGRRDQLVPLLRAHGARCLKDEPGTLHFEVLVPRDDDAKLFVYEVYRDDSAFEAHRNAASIARFREEAAGLYETIHATRCTPVE
jgi:quinol monooxygenase YgiN